MVGNVSVDCVKVDSVERVKFAEIIYDVDMPS